MGLINIFTKERGLEGEILEASGIVTVLWEGVVTKRHWATSTVSCHLTHLPGMILWPVFGGRMGFEIILKTLGERKTVG